MDKKYNHQQSKIEKGGVRLKQEQSRGERERERERESKYRMGRRGRKERGNKRTGVGEKEGDK